MKIDLINNEKFEKLTNAEKRVEICKDVIARLKANLIKPNTGSFWDSKINGSPETSMQEQINSSKCSVCAKGALFCAWVGNFNEVTVGDFGSGYLEEVEHLEGVTPELVKLFGREMLDNIEAAFEGETFCWHYDEAETVEYVFAFKDYELIDIMEYIIKNKGDFPLPLNEGL